MEHGKTAVPPCLTVMLFGVAMNTGSMGMCVYVSYMSSKSATTSK